MGNNNDKLAAKAADQIDSKQSNPPNGSTDHGNDSAFMVPESEQKQVEFQIFIGIDFGTDGCGLCYAFKTEPDDELDTAALAEVEIHPVFKDGNGPYDKTRTSVLLDADNVVQCVGGEAANIFVQTKHSGNWKLFERFKMSLYVDPNWRAPQIVSTKAVDSAHSFSKVDLKDMIVPSNGGDPFPAKHIFIAELRKLREAALQHLQSRRHRVRSKHKKFSFSEHEIQWILTVPAIWSDYAKNKMKEWAMEAQLIDARIKQQLKIVYEPDCASLTVQHLCNKWKHHNDSGNATNTDHDVNAAVIQFDDSDDEDQEYGVVDGSYRQHAASKSSPIGNGNDNDNEESKYTDEDERKYASPKSYTWQLKSQVVYLRADSDAGIRLQAGDVYVLLDCGGGTCDIACHRIIEQFAIEEVMHPTGGQWGSINIDTNFVHLLHAMFGQACIEQFASECASMWLQLQNNFCIDSKATFYNDATRQEAFHFVTLPRNFSLFILRQYHDDVQHVQQHLDALSMQLFNEAGLFKWDIAEYCSTLQIHNKVFINELFEKNCIAPIVKHLYKIFNANEMQHCKYLILVGGLANSCYYQQRIYNAFGRGSRLKILVPDKPQLCVVEGAARYGLKPDFIQIRVLSRTYGIRIDYALQSLPNRSEYDAEWLAENTYQCQETKRKFVRNIFSVFVRKNKAIKFSEKPIVQTYFRRHAKQKTIDIKIYSSSQQNPLHVLEADCFELAQIKLFFNTNRENQTNELEIKVEFWFNDTTLKVYAYPKHNINMRKECKVNYL